MEDLLPSEIARLVLGYLQEESCEDAAKCFLEKSPHLAECLSMSRKGRKFATKVSGYTLSDILEQFCSIYSIVQEQVNALPPGNEQLKHGSLTDQLKHIFKAQCPVQVKITLSSQQNGQNTSNGDSGSDVATSTPRVRNSRKSVSRFQNVLDQSDTYLEPSPAASPPTATPLESLPGNSGHVVENTGPDVPTLPTSETPGIAPSTSNLNEVDYTDNTRPKDYNAACDKPFLPFAPPATDINLPPSFSVQEQDNQFMPGPGTFVDSSRPFVYVPNLSASSLNSGPNRFANIANWKSAAPDSKFPCVVTDHCGSKIVLVGMENISENSLSVFHHIPRFQVADMSRNELSEQVGTDARELPDFLAAKLY